MSLRFLHTADWQLGRRFGFIEDSSKREALRAARFKAVERIAEVCRDEKAQFVVVAGDLFDSPTTDRATLSHGLALIGAIPAPVYVIPGNHDHAGPGTFWESPHYLSEQPKLAPNLFLLDAAAPVILEQAVLLPCPLHGRSASGSPLAWLAAAPELPPDLPRILLAHGSVTQFGGTSGEASGSGGNFLDLELLPPGFVDYAALGDWHGTRGIEPHVWYSGTPEPDRFAKGADYHAGSILLVELAARAAVPVVRPVATATVLWHRVCEAIGTNDGLSAFEQDLSKLLGERVLRDAVSFELSGTLSLADGRRLRDLLELWETRLLHMEILSLPSTQPDGDEVAELCGRAGDPLISAVAAQLVSELSSESAVVSSEALRLLFSEIGVLAQEGGLA